MINEKASTIDVEVVGRQYEIRQSPGLLTSSRSEGTTGAVLWRITPFVAEWLANKSNVLWSNGLLHADATVVELGCGISGLIGIVLAQYVSKYVLTDLGYVMKLLQQNVDTNQTATFLHKGTKRQPAMKPQVLVLDWEDMSSTRFDEVVKHDEVVDMVVACDCVYNEYLLEPFVNMCENISQRDVQRRPFILIAQQLRSDEVFSAFMSLLLRKFHIWRLSQEALSPALQNGGAFAVHIAILR